jgi:hypothetical protein
LRQRKGATGKYSHIGIEQMLQPDDAVQQN